MGKKTIKIADGVRIHTATEDIDVNGMRGVWDVFGWDIDNDENAKECAHMITTELYCFGHINLTKMNNGKLLVLSLIPPKDADDSEEKGA